MQEAFIPRKTSQVFLGMTDDSDWWGVMDPVGGSSCVPRVPCYEYKHMANIAVGHLAPPPLLIKDSEMPAWLGLRPHQLHFSSSFYIQLILYYPSNLKGFVTKVASYFSSTNLWTFVWIRMLIFITYVRWVLSHSTKKSILILSIFYVFHVSFNSSITRTTTVMYYESEFWVIFLF